MDRGCLHGLSGFRKENPGRASETESHPGKAGGRGRGLHRLYRTDRKRRTQSDFGQADQGVNRLGVTVDFLLADYVVATDDNSINILIQLMHDRTAEEKTLAINLLKVLFANK